VGETPLISKQMPLLIFVALFPMIIPLQCLQTLLVQTSPQSEGDIYNGPIYCSAEFEYNPVVENGFTTLFVSVYTDWIRQNSPPSEFVDVHLTINSSLTVIYKNAHTSALDLRLFWEQGYIWNEIFYRLHEDLSFIVNASLPVGDYPLSVSVIHGNWSFTANKILSIRKPLEITFNITDEKGHPLNVIKFQVISKNKGEYTPKYVGNGVFQAILPEGEYNVILNYTYYLFYISTEYTSSISVHNAKTVTLTLESGINIFNIGAILTLIFTVIGLIFFKRKEIVSGGFLFYLSFVALLHMLLNNGFWIFPPNWGWGSLILTLLIPLSAALIYGAVLYYTQYTYIKFTWILTSNIISLLLTTVPSMYNLYLKIEIVFALWMISIITPFIVYDMTQKRMSELSRIRSLDREVLDVAKNYGGILTASVLVWELNIQLEEAQRILDRFCKLGEAAKRRTGSVMIYDFPSARAYLSRTDNQIIELLRDNPYGMSRAQLLQVASLSIESLDEVLKRLESRGIIYYETGNDAYKLRGISPATAQYPKK